LKANAGETPAVTMSAISSARSVSEPALAAISLRVPMARPVPPFASRSARAYAREHAARERRPWNHAKPHFAPSE
jgi:hypothetical protein